MIKTISHLLILIAILTFSIPALTASPKKKKKKVQVEVTDQERKNSIAFADALRDFYSQNYDAAENTLRTIINTTPTHAPSLFILSKIAVEKKDNNLAQNYLEQAIALDKDNIFYQLEIAKVLDLLGDYKNSVKYWEVICEEKYNNENYLIALANAYFQLNRLMDVIKTYDKMESVIGKIDQLVAMKKELWLFQNNVKGAVSEYDKMIEAYPHETQYYAIAADIYLKNNMNQQALTYLQNGSKVNPNHGLLNLAWFDYYNAIDNKENAEQAIFTAIECPDLSFEEKLDYLLAYMPQAELNEKEKGLRVLNAIEKLTILHPEQYEAWAYLSKMQEKVDQFEAAAMSAKKAIDLENTDPVLWEFYLHLLHETNQHDKIVVEKDYLLETFPTISTINYYIAFALAEKNKCDQSIEVLKAALPYIYESSVLANYYLLIGDCYLTLDNIPEAVANWKQAQKKGLKTPELLEKIKNYDRP